MVIHCAQSPAVSSIPRRFLLVEKSFLHGQKIVNVRIDKKTSPHVGKIGLVDFKTRAASGSTRIVSQAQDVAAASTSASDTSTNTKDKNVVFVAGATGKVGSRTVRELLKLGFNVRAGVRSIQRAESLVQSVKNMKVGEGNTQPIDKLELVECDLEKPSQIRPALGNSSTVICCIGASEKEVFDVTGPYRIDYVATKNLIDAATSAKVNHFALLTSLGTNKFGFPAAILNLFWGVLCWKRRAEEALLASGLPYTIVRPGGMERPTDSYKETHNITLSEEDTLFGGQVSNLQVAELLAFMAKNQRLSYCKVVEVIAETTAPLTPLDELLKKIPSKREVPPQESDDADKSEPTITDSDSITEKKTAQEKITVTKEAQSPYAVYEDLKPPTSPTPTPSTGSSAPKGTTIDATSTASSPVEVVNSSEPSSISTVNAEPEPSAAKKPYFLSPYPFYEGFKPPTSPTPTPSTGSSAPKGTTIDATSTASSPVEVVNSSEPSSISTVNAEPELSAAKKPYFLSPYPYYEGFKPPTSPTPTPSDGSDAPKGITFAAASTTSVEVNSSDTSSASTEGDEAKAVPKPTYFLSPYPNYEDLKPPSSPTPTPSVSNKERSTSQITASDNGTLNDVATNGYPNDSEPGNPANGNLQITSRTRPLSPYTMYEDLKPPTSPSPSPKTL